MYLRFISQIMSLVEELHKNTSHNSINLMNSEHFCWLLTYLKMWFTVLFGKLLQIKTTHSTLTWNRQMPYFLYFPYLYKLIGLGPLVTEIKITTVELHLCRVCVLMCVRACVCVQTRLHLTRAYQDLPKVPSVQTVTPLLLSCFWAVSHSQDYFEFTLTWRLGVHDTYI